MGNVAALPVLLKELKLASFAKHWESLAQKAIDEKCLPQTYLAELCDQEAGSRYQKKLQRYLREAQLPPAKQLSQFDFRASSGINKPLIVALTQQRNWVDQAENILFFGASGVSKTHLACGIGYVKKSSDETQVLFELIAHRYETGSLIITSNQPFSAWDKIFDDNMMTVAAIDRLVHHATIIEIKGESFRKKASMKRKEKQKISK